MLLRLVVVRGLSVVVPLEVLHGIAILCRFGTAINVQLAPGAQKGAAEGGPTQYPPYPYSFHGIAQLNV